MKESSWNRLKSSWNSEQKFQNRKLSQTEIQEYIESKSSEYSQIVTRTLLFDVVLKTILFLSLLGIILITPFDSSIRIVAEMSSIFIILLLIQLIKLKNQIPNENHTDLNLFAKLEQWIYFFDQLQSKFLIIVSLSSPLLFVAGNLWYYDFKYEGIPNLDIDDIFVLGGFLLISYGFSFFSYFNQLNRMELDIKQTYEEAKSDEIDTAFLHATQSKKRWRQLLLGLLVLLGLLSLLLLITSYLT